MTRPSTDRPDRIEPEGGLSRRQFLAGSAGAVAAGLLAARVGGSSSALAHEATAGHDHADPSVHIWAATFDGNRYLGLTGDGERAQIAELVVDGDAVHLGSSIGAELPEDFAAQALLAVSGRLLVAGATVREVQTEPLSGEGDLRPADRGGMPTDEGFADTVAVPVYTVRPTLLEVTPDGPRALPLEEQAPKGFGVASQLASLPGNRLAVMIEGSGNAEQTYNDVTRLAESADSHGQVWSFDVIASGLGEGFKSHLAAASGRIFAATTDQDGERGFHQRSLRPGADWRALATDGGDGPLLGATPRGGDTVEILSRTDGEVTRLRHEPGRSGWHRAGTVTVPGGVLDAVAVTGTRGQFVALGPSDAVLVR